jgi:hypothetical protein
VGISLPLQGGPEKELEGAREAIRFRKRKPERLPVETREYFLF